MNREVRNNLFYEARSREMLASALGTLPKSLAYYLYKVPEQDRYKKKEIRKKSGKVRNVAAPVKSLKFMQRSLSDILNDTLKPKSCVHGFTPHKSIITNARQHLHRRYIVNIDLKDFFPSINFGRVLGLFKAEPFSFNDEVAVTLAQLCCFEGSLPQGSPCSPVISNLICRAMDNQLMRLAKEAKMTYTRYADDITFSTNRKELPAEIGKVEDGKLVLSEKLTAIIESNGFEINASKVRCRTRNQRQVVTGVVTTEVLNVPRNYVRRIRAMLHAWEAYGLSKAAEEHFSKYSHKTIEYPEASFKKRVAGMIGYVGMVKGIKSEVYARLFSKLKSLDETVSLRIPEYTGSARMIVYCEGITDPMHLKAALNHFRSKGQFSGLSIDFHRYREDASIGHGELYKIMCGRYLVKQSDEIEVYLFDNDIDKYVKELTGLKYIKKGHDKVLMALLPQPTHRDFKDVCIEHFYKDEDLMRVDSKGRRIYFAREFDQKTGQHVSEPVRSMFLQPLKRPGHTLIVDGIRDDNDRSIALSKKDYASLILSKAPSHADVDFTAFQSIFEMFEEILG